MELSMKDKRELYEYLCAVGNLGSSVDWDDFMEICDASPDLYRDLRSAHTEIEIITAEIQDRLGDNPFPNTDLLIISNN